MADQLPSPAQFGSAFREFMDAMVRAAGPDVDRLYERLRAHLQTDPDGLPITSASFPAFEQANLQLALDVVLGDCETLGVEGARIRHARSLAQLITRPSHPGRGVAPVEYSDVPLGDGRVIRCLASGLLLGRFDGAPLAVLLTREQRPPFGQLDVVLEGVAPAPATVSELLEALRAAMREHNIFRGRVISLRGDGVPEFHAIPAVAREAVILPDGTLERLEAHALGISDHAKTLKEAGKHLKRGLLLHGPPGTGKTLTVNHLLSRTARRTTILLSGHGTSFVESAVAIARELAPATVVLEDVDLVAHERTGPHGQGLLFELLNLMDGLAEDTDLLFLLTTNRPDVIEPALAARPGRVDLALELPLPDEPARRRLLALYAGQLELNGDSLAALAADSEGVSGAFIKELMRQAHLRAALHHRPPTPADALQALEELMSDRAALTGRLLGRLSGSDGSAEPAPGMSRAVAAAGLQAR